MGQEWAWCGWNKAGKPAPGAGTGGGVREEWARAEARAGAGPAGLMGCSRELQYFFLPRGDGKPLEGSEQGKP